MSLWHPCAWWKWIHLQLTSSKKTSHFCKNHLKVIFLIGKRLLVFPGNYMQNLIFIQRLHVSFWAIWLKYFVGDLTYRLALRFDAVTFVLILYCKYCFECYITLLILRSVIEITRWKCSILPILSYNEFKHRQTPFKFYSRFCCPVCYRLKTDIMIRIQNWWCLKYFYSIIVKTKIYIK